jgi:class 3 adenylate cyclase
MLLFRDPSRAAAAAMRVVQQRSGKRVCLRTLHQCGPVIQRDMDVSGRTVNLASRLVDRVAAGEVLAAGASGTWFKRGSGSKNARIPTGGILEPVTSYRVRVIGED